MLGFHRFLRGAVFVAAMSAWSRAGNDHIENGQVPSAGGLSGTAQLIKKKCPPVLQIIEGELSGDLRGVEDPDYEDMYRIVIDDSGTFSASTCDGDCAVSDTSHVNECGMAEFDAQLWLFRRDLLTGNAIGVLANDNVSECDDPTAARIGTGPVGCGATAIGRFSVGGLPAGEYYLAISPSGRVPRSLGTDVFSFGCLTQVAGPNVLTAHDAWNGTPGGLGSYRIILTGASSHPKCPTLSNSGYWATAVLVLIAGAKLMNTSRTKTGEARACVPNAIV